ncbi:MAG: 5-Enolpyruvylshikimate-3-phosphate synthase (EC [uncultured Campylobacterales bacterium]|uniref:3-phosphoshikimate 1-carboxyvinyltransferase n=1 Tax=uncultured Campylobacterales bacterium TaxID=352960 RepID=A0A6S6T6Z9_9BACT|nr:MAG: 5-Enolpyruvylshikimate-3-phosphate synthase (EC [uncultured Campylobacterales bacterium]
MLSINKASSFDIEINDIASDKSISHRCAIFSLLSDEPSVIRNFLRGEDTMNSLKIAGAVGAKTHDDGDTITITPPKSIKSPLVPLDCGNAGTGIRLYMGLFAGIKGEQFVLYGDESLSVRPMNRISKPLESIGAEVRGRDNGNLSPLIIFGKELESFEYESKVASAQVKSAMILAGLHAKSKSIYSCKKKSRDHSERMLLGMGADIECDTSNGDKIEINPMKTPLKGLDISVPGDPSSGFFFAVAAAMIPGSCVVLKNMLLNPTRIEAYNVLSQMGAKVEFIQKSEKYESIGDIKVSYNELNAVTVDSNIASLIDELPALAIAMAEAKGTSKVRNAKELRAKESDRISSVVQSLKSCDIEVVEHEDGYEIVGSKLKGARIKNYDDHRIAMSFAIAGLVCGDMEVEGEEYILTSFPNFVDILSRIGDVRNAD